MNSSPNRRVLLAGFASVMATTACGLPRSGPKTKEIMAGTQLVQNPSFVVPVTQPIAKAATLYETFTFPSSFLNAGLLGSDTIYAGDKLTISVWENVDDGVMGQRGTPTMLQDTQVDGQGYIYIPYAGRVRASGMSPDELRVDLTERLSAQTPNPQVQVARVAGDGASVSVIGDVSGQGVYPIERPTRNLSAMIARAGGVSIKPAITQVTVTRGSQSGSVWLKDLYENPRLDIPLRGGDIILVSQDSRSFTALGSTSGQARVPFPSPTISALEGIAVVGGLQSMLADPKGVFIFREETPQITNAVLGRTDITSPQNVVYLLNLTEPNGMFTAREFMLRDGDTMYVTEAPYTQWTKILSVLTGSATSANSLANIAGG